MTLPNLLAQSKIEATNDSAFLIHLNSNQVNKYLNTVENKIDYYKKQSYKKTLKTLQKLARWEKKIQHTLNKIDPHKSKELFERSVTFQSLLNEFEKTSRKVLKVKTVYDQKRDEYFTNVKYLITQSSEWNSKIKTSIQDVDIKIEKINENADELSYINDVIKKRKMELINASIRLLGKNKYISKINKESWYYQESIKNLNDIFNEPTKIEALVKKALTQSKQFRDFARSNSLISRFFGNNLTINSINNELLGLQTRVQISTEIQNVLQPIGSNAINIFSNKMHEAFSEFEVYKQNYLNKHNSSFSEIPDFKPNTQKTKTFKQRLEFGYNIQFNKERFTIPNQVEPSINIGYKLNDKSTIGLGAAYKVGLGNWQKLSFSNEGWGVRSIIDWKLKKQIYITGGFEYYFSDKYSIPNNNLYNNYEVAVIGLTKKIKINNKKNKTSNIQILYDILHQPKNGGSPLKFRYGKSF